MRKREHGLLPNAASLLLCGLLAGLVVAAAAFPAIALSGLAAKAGADTFDALPTNIDVLPSPQISYVYASDGKTLLAMFFDEARRDVPLTDVAEVMQQAIVAAEDNRFYDHRGVDVKGVARAFVANQRDGATEQGASTLTMQYVRQVIAYSATTPQAVIDATNKTTARKLREMKLAIALEKKLTKKEILERYLNIAAYGHGAYGIFAASQVYFNKTPKDLTLPEAALLASLVKAPSNFDPATEKGRPRAIERSNNYTLKNMVQLKYITEEQRTEAINTKLEIKGTPTPRNCTSVQRPELGAGFFCDYLRRWWLDQPAFGNDTYERANKLGSGGYTIISSLNLVTQAAAWKYAQHQPGDTPKSQQVTVGDHRALMLAAIEPATGRVQAIATNRVFSNDQSNNGANTNPDKKGQKGNYPNTTVPIVTGDDDIPGYQAGSTFKMFTAVAALEAGYPLATTINTESPFHSNYIAGFGQPGACPGEKYYCVKGPAGNFNMWTAFQKSINTFFVPLQQSIGTEHVVDVAKRLGIQFRADNDKIAYDKPADAHAHGAFTLGVTATTPLQLANAYGSLANNGVHCDPTPVVEIKDLQGNKIDAANPRCKQVVDPEIAKAGVDMARCPVGDRSMVGGCGSGGTAPYGRGFVGRPIAAKTGTTDGEQSATFVVMTKQLAVSGFLTDPDWPQTREDMKHPPVNYAALGTLKDALAGQGLPVVDFDKPNKDKTFGKLVGIPDVKCKSPGEATARLKAAGFTVSVSRGQVASECPAGTVAKTSPSGSTPRGSAIQLLISKGPGNAGPLPPGQQPGQPPGRRAPATPTEPDVCPLPWVCPPNQD